MVLSSSLLAVEPFHAWRYDSTLNAPTHSPMAPQVPVRWASLPPPTLLARTTGTVAFVPTPSPPLAALTLTRITQSVSEQGAVFGRWLVRTLEAQGQMEGGFHMDANAIMWGGTRYAPPALRPQRAAPSQVPAMWPKKIQDMMAHKTYARLAPTQLTHQERAQARCCITLDHLDALAQPVAVRSGHAVQVYAFDALMQAFAVCPQRGPYTPDGLPVSDVLRVVDG